MEGRSMLLSGAADGSEFSASRDDPVTDTRTFSH
jgi:hypothetical protein